MQKEMREHSLVRVLLRHSSPTIKRELVCRFEGESIVVTVFNSIITGPGGSRNQGYNGLSEN